MLSFLQTLRERNEPLFWFGLIQFVLAITALILTRYSKIEVAGVNAWYKPFKFSASTFIYIWTIAWILPYLTEFNVTRYNAVIIALFTFEIAYIFIQAGRGEMSHFNLSNGFYRVMYSGMAIAASGITIYTLIIGIEFFSSRVIQLPPAYLWSIRWGIVLFVIFAFEGFVMGSRLTHTIGGPDGGASLPLVKWSILHGDARIAHFIGMHALQIIPLLGWYVFSHPRWIHAVALLYGALAVLALVQALNGNAVTSGRILAKKASEQTSDRLP